MTIFIVGILLFLYSFFARKNYDVRIAFLFVLFIMGFQTLGTDDYEMYKGGFDNGGIIYTTKDMEIGWIGMNKFFQFANFHTMLFFMSLFECIVCAYFIRLATVRQMIWMGALLFFFCQPCMLMMMWALRQGMAIAFCILAFCAAYKNKLLLSLLFGVAAFSFHNSAALMLPILLLYLFYKRYSCHRTSILHKLLELFRRNVLIIVPLVLMVLIFLKKTVINSYLIPLALASTTEENYNGYTEILEITEFAWWVSVYFFMHGVIFSLAFKNLKEGRLFIFLSLLSIFSNLIFWGIGDLMRISNYFIIFNIVTIPNVVNMLRKRYRMGQIYALLYLLIIAVVELRNFLPWLFDEKGYNFHTYKLLFFS